MSDSPATLTAPVLDAGSLLAHWQGHRSLTRRMIEAFPEDELFTFNAGGMRPFAQLAAEMLQMIAPTMKGALEDVWEAGGYGAPAPTTKAGLLAAWDEADGVLAESFPKIPAERFGEEANAFGLWRAPVITTLLYLIDNEVHHRGQGYVYLRMLGIEPPLFYQRSTLTAGRG
ncbi:MAG TPA: DinB family protein [Trueperaceae bacterium]|nr:DinB family protein [Trueperaceae bacterium]